jgi:DNA helicase-2/ATP-dependent DNA helicase PcrA
VADQLLELREEGIDLEQVAVLYRNHSHALDLQVELTRRNIPYRVRSGLRFFEQRHIKDVISHLRFVDNPRDEVAFARALKLREGFGVRLTAKVWEYLTGGDPVGTLVEMDPAELGLRSAAADSLVSLQQLIDELRTGEMAGQPGESLRIVVERFYRDWSRANLDNAASRLEDLEQLALFADGYPDVNTFLAEVTLLNDLSGEDAVGGPVDELVTLSTAHRAKGLEWRVVFMIWLSEGRFPTVRAEDEEEERRLFYVAVTRAKDRLHLVHPEIARDRYRVDVIVEPSRFLQELPPTVTESLTVKEERQPDGLDALPASRYRIPSFVDDNRDSGDVN